VLNGTSPNSELTIFSINSHISSDYSALWGPIGTWEFHFKFLREALEALWNEVEGGKSPSWHDYNQFCHLEVLTLEKTLLLYFIFGYFLKKKLHDSLKI
jgi:hypothetical protein